MPIPAVDAPERAQRWLDGHRVTLVAIGEYTARHGWPRHCVDLSQALWRYLEVGGHYQEALALHTTAAAAGDHRDAAAALANLGALHRRLGGYEESAEHQRRAAKVFADIGDRRLEGYALGNLGAVYGLLGRGTEAMSPTLT